MKEPTTALVLVVVAAALTGWALTGCESMRAAVETSARIVERELADEQPGPIAGALDIEEEDREKWLAGARAVRSLVSEIDTAEEIALGQSLAARAFVSLGRPHPDEALQRYVNKVGRLVAMQSERPSLPYFFCVIQKQEPNALALPGGYVFVSTGLLERLRSESELACILAHEVAHVAQKHGVAVVARDSRIASLIELGATLEEDVAKYRELIDLSYKKLTTEGYDRNYEWKADLAGTDYAYRAGYHPEGLLPFLRASAASGEQLAFEVFKTHPDPGVRIGKINGLLAQLGDYAGMPRLADRYRSSALSRLQ